MTLFSRPCSVEFATGTAIALDARAKAREMSAENCIVAVYKKKILVDDLVAGESKLLLMSPSMWDLSHLIYFSHIEPPLSSCASRFSIAFSVHEAAQPDLTHHRHCATHHHIHAMRRRLKFALHLS